MSLILAAMASVGLVSCAPAHREVGPVASLRPVRELCDRLAAFARAELGAVQVRVARGDSDRPIGERATCDLRGPSDYGIEAGALTVSLSLTGKSGAPLASGGDYRIVPGITPTVVVNRANATPLFSTEVDGWSGVMTVDPDGLVTPHGSADTGPGADGKYAEFLVSLVRDYGRWE